MLFALMMHLEGCRLIKLLRQMFKICPLHSGTKFGLLTILNQLAIRFEDR